MRSKLVFPRETLLIEVERWHREPSCGGRTRIALTKDEAHSYTGYECARCERWQKDALTEREIPEWWEELKVTSLDGVRESDAKCEATPGEVVARLSEAWNRLGAGEGKEEPEKEERTGN